MWNVKTCRSYRKGTDNIMSRVDLVEKKLCEKITYKYRKNRKNNKCNKIQDLEREQAEKGPEKSANIAKIEKVTRIFLTS